MHPMFLMRRPATVFLLTIAAVVGVAATLIQGQAPQLRAPSFQVDPNWPSIPNNWVLGEVSSIAVDPRDHIWVLHRPASIPAA